MTASKKNKFSNYSKSKLSFYRTHNSLFFLIVFFFLLHFFLTISLKSCENSNTVGNSLKYERIDKNLLNVFIQVHMQEDLNTTSFDLHLFPLSQVFLRIIVVYFTLTERPSDEKRHEIYANLEI